MTRFVQRLKNITYEYGMGRMSKEFRTFAYVYFALDAALILTSIFISAFLFNVSGKMSTIAAYYLFFYLFEMCGIYSVVRFSHKINNVTFVITGLILYASAYAMLLIARENSIHIYPIIAAVAGLGSGFYWVNYYTLFMVYTTPEKRQYGMAFITLVINITALVAPVISGTILSKVAGTAGYVIIFSIALTFFSLAVIVALKLRGTAPENKSRKLWPVVKKMWHKKVVNLGIAGEFISGLRGGVYAFYLSVLIYSMTSNEFILGLSDTIKGAVAILASYMLSRINFKSKGRIAMLLSALTLSLTITGSLFVWYGALAVIVYYVINYTSDAVAEHFRTYIGYEIAECSSKHCGEDCTMEYSAIKLLALEIGRVCGIGLSFLIPGDDKNWILIFFVILTAINLCGGFIYRKAARICASEE